MYVLMIEDRHLAASFLHHEMVQAGHTVDLAVDGRSGLAHALATGYDAVLLNPALPDLDGFELLQRLRNQGCLVPVLILTNAEKSVGDRLDDAMQPWTKRSFMRLEKPSVRIRI